MAQLKDPYEKSYKMCFDNLTQIEKLFSQNRQLQFKVIIAAGSISPSLSKVKFVIDRWKLTQSRLDLEMHEPSLK